MNPYQILKVAENATLSEIKLAYKILAQRNHPDKGGDKEKFSQIQAAYEILKDPERRKQYDQTGSWEAPKPKEQMAVAELMTCFDHWLQQVINGQRPANEDCVKFMEDTFTQGLSNAKREVSKADQAEERLRIVLEKFQGGQSDLMNGHAQSRMKSITDQRDNINHRIEIMEAAKEMLKDIEYTYDKGIQFRDGQTFANSTMGGINTGTTSWR